MEKHEIKYLILKGYSKLEIIRKIRQQGNLETSMKEIITTIDECEHVKEGAGKLIGCSGAEEGCIGYPKCFEVYTCLVKGVN